MAGYGVRAFLIAQSPQPDRQGLWREQCHPRQLPCARRLRDQRRADGQAHLRRARNGDRAARDAQLCRPPARALARPCHGQPPGDVAAAADAGRGDAAAARGRAGPGLGPARRSAPSKLRYYRGPQLHRSAAAAAGPARRPLCRSPRAAARTTGAARWPRLSPDPEAEFAFGRGRRRPSAGAASRFAIAGGARNGRTRTSSSSSASRRRLAIRRSRLQAMDEASAAAARARRACRQRRLGSRPRPDAELLTAMTSCLRIHGPQACDAAHRHGRGHRGRPRRSARPRGDGQSRRSSSARPARLRAKRHRGSILEPAQIERIIRLVASHARTEVHGAAPIVSAELPPHGEGLAGERFEGILPPVATGPCFSIRKPASRIYTLLDYVSDGIMTAEAARAAVARSRRAAQHPGRRRDQLGQDHARQCAARRTRRPRRAGHPDRGHARAAMRRAATRWRFGRVRASVTMADLVRSTLRLRPDRIIVGEVRGGEALDMLKAWNTGHPGGIATVHANSARVGALPARAADPGSRRHRAAAADRRRDRPHRLHRGAGHRPPDRRDRPPSKGSIRPATTRVRPLDPDNSAA